MAYIKRGRKRKNNDYAKYKKKKKEKLSKLDNKYIVDDDELYTLKFYLLSKIDNSESVEGFNNIL